jgi:CRP/FNR family transcriptional regulator
MQTNVISFPASAVSCANCRWSKFCVARNLDAAGKAEVSKHVICSGPIRRGEHLFRQGDALQAFHVVRAGSVKSYLDSEDGCEQAIGFHYPGDMLGFDALAEGRYSTSAVALETTAYCSIPYDRVLTLANALPALWQEVMRAAAGQVMEAQNHALLLGQKSAPARLANFLLYLSNRFAARGLSRTEFNLSMSRQEIANYLAVAVETISRLFTELQRQGMIEVDRRFVRILSTDGLKELAYEGQLLGACSA